MLPRALGPFKFVSYKPGTGTVAVIENLAGRRIDCSVANLIPLRAGVRPLQQWRAQLTNNALPTGMEAEMLFESEGEQEK